MDKSMIRFRSGGVKSCKFILLPAMVLLFALSVLSLPVAVSAGQTAGAQTAALHGASWHVEVAVGQAEQQKLVEVASKTESGLTDKGISLRAGRGDDGAPNSVLAGTGVDRLRALLFGSTLSRAGIPGGPYKLKMAGKVARDQLVTIVLEARLSAGYSWEVAHPGESGFIVQESGKFQGTGGGPGRSLKQTIVLKALKAGDSVIHLVYRRPFDPDEKAAANISIDVGDLPGAIDLSNPSRPVVSVPVERRPAATAEHIPPIRPSTPSAYTDYTKFDWREWGGVTKVKDQKTCGSCWAFTTVATLESALRRVYGFEYDLSEQFLVSCNDVVDPDTGERWGCGGGYFAHFYHLSSGNPGAALGKLQTLNGAVLETAMPYKAADLECKTIKDHPLWMHNWSRRGDGKTLGSVTDEELKELIYTYGPIGVSVCAGEKFQAYKEGVFESDEWWTVDECRTNGGNHMVLLVGWNDVNPTQRYWIVKNSWGTKWGQQGYMFMKQGISGIGVDAGYVEDPYVNCDYALTVSGKNNPYYKVASSGANVTVGVSTAVYCPAPNVLLNGADSLWLSLAGQTWNNLKGTVKFKVEKSPSSISRQADVIIGTNATNLGTHFDIQQAGAACMFAGIEISPEAKTFTSAGGTRSFNVKVNPSDCPWVVTALPYYWMQTDGDDKQMTGNRTVTFEVAPNASGASRTGKITITLQQALQNPKKASISITQGK